MHSTRGLTRALTLAVILLLLPTLASAQQPVRIAQGFALADSSRYGGRAH